MSPKYKSKINNMKIIRLAIRSILNFRTYSSINILGMALALACVVTIFRYVYGEMNVDRFNKKIDRIFVSTFERSTSPGEVRFSGIFNSNQETAFVDLTEHSGVEKFSHFIWFESDEIDVDDRKFNATILMADSNFLKITDYPVMLGIERLYQPNSALVTHSFAQKLFGKENPVGKTFRHSTGEILTITGVIGQIPTKSTLSFDVIVSYDLWEMLMQWSTPQQTLVMLYPGVDYRAVNKHYEEFYEMGGWQPQFQRHQLFPLSDLYFEKNIEKSNVYGQGNYNYVAVLMAIGFLILLAGVINYINICTVVVLRRGKELGIKKIFGAGSHNIFVQLLVENLFMTGLALIFAFLFARAAFPFVTGALQLDQIYSLRFDMLLSLCILLILPLLTTLYPFFRYHYSMPVNSMRNFDKIRGGSLRRVLLSFQYIITIVMIVVSLFFIKQLRFMLNTDTGYRTEDIIKVQFLKEPTRTRTVNVEELQMRRDRENRIADEIVQKMNACPLFTCWTYGRQSPNGFSKGGTPFKLPEGEYKHINLESVSESWFRLFDISLINGRLWDDEKDSWYDYALIVTESVLKLYGITDFNEARLQPETRLWMSTLRPKEEMATNPPYRIVGVVKDFDYLHLSQKSEPMAFSYSLKYSDSGRSLIYYPLIAAIVPGRTQEAIAFMRKLHEETVGGDFACSFVSDEVREMYREDKKIATIYSVFTLIAIFVSVLGLLSMSLFDIQQRRKEIAIRKINGASFSDIIKLLLKKYFWTLGISFFIATPVAIFAINRYLDGFANKVPVTWWLFAVAATLTACVSLLTLIYQTLQAANRNPAEIMNNE